MTDQHISDCELLPSSKLRERYKTEANSHRAMLDRRKLGAVVASELLSFRDYLRLIGPCPAPGYTVDRLNSNDPEYAVSKIAWRSKTDQSRNRRNVIVLKDTDGTSLPLTEWAERTHQSRHTLHARRKRGFTDIEVIHGRVYGPKVIGSITTDIAWPIGFEDRFEKGFKNRDGYRIRPKGVETRLEYLLLQCIIRRNWLCCEVERSMPPDIGDISAEQEKLLRTWHFWGNELRRACRLAGPTLTMFYLNILVRVKPWEH